MPLVEFTPTTAPVADPAPSDKYRQLTIEGQYYDLSAFASYVEGYSLTVDYYEQILAQHSEPREIDPALAPLYQAYRKIQRLNIKVVQPLALAYNDVLHLGNVTGSAVLPLEVIPNIYDLLVFTTTRGSNALFRVTNVRRLSIHRDTLYEVQYQMIGYTDQGVAQTLLENLQIKTTATAVFDAARQRLGLPGLLLDSVDASLRTLDALEPRIVGHLLETFYHYEVATFVLPGQNEIIHDPYWHQTLFKLVDSEDHPLVPRSNTYALAASFVTSRRTVWDALLHPETVRLRGCVKEFQVTARTTFSKNSYLGNGAYLRVPFYLTPSKLSVSPQLPNDPAFSDSETMVFLPSETETGTPYNYTLGEDLPYFIPVSLLTPYVFSAAFYTELSVESLMEKVAQDLIMDRALTAAEIAVLGTHYWDLPRLDQFYYGLVLLIAMRKARIRHVS